MARRRRERGRPGRLVLGLFLLAIGVLLIASRIGFDVPDSIGQYWPFLLVALGLAKMLWPGDEGEWRGGMWLLAAGLYCWVSTRSLWGLGWETAWPIFLIVGGLQIVLGAAAPKRELAARDGDES